MKRAACFGVVCLMTGTVAGAYLQRNYGRNPIAITVPVPYPSDKPFIELRGDGLSNLYINGMEFRGGLLEFYRKTGAFPPRCRDVPSDKYGCIDWLSQDEVKAGKTYDNVLKWKRWRNEDSIK